MPRNDDFITKTYRDVNKEQNNEVGKMDRNIQKEPTNEVGEVGMTTLK